jgi:hypothetical protein
MSLQVTVVNTDLKISTTEDTNIWTNKSISVSTQLCLFESFVDTDIDLFIDVIDVQQDVTRKNRSFSV